MDQEKNYPGEFLASEANGTRSRDVVTIASGQVIEAGQVLGKVTATGKYVAHNNANVDGSQTAAAVAYEAVDASLADTTVTAILRDAEVYTSKLIHAVAGDAANAITELAAVGIIAR